MHLLSWHANQSIPEESIPQATLAVALGYDIGRSSGGQEMDVSGPEPADAGMADLGEAVGRETCDLDDCACTGKNIGKYTSPAALLAIAEAGSISGYDIAERLRSMPLGGESGPDSGGLYRTLRRMERYNLVTSTWDTEGGGPARRLYALTNLGDRCLERWALTLAEHESAIEGFLADYLKLKDEAQR